MRPSFSILIWAFVGQTALLSANRAFIVTDLRALKSLPVDGVRQPPANLAFQRTTVPALDDELVNHHERQVSILETVDG